MSSAFATWPMQVAQVGDCLDYSLLGLLASLTSSLQHVLRWEGIQEGSGLLAAVATYVIVSWERDC